MSSDERADVLRGGTDVLRGIAAQLRAELPPPEHEDAAALRELAGVVRLVDRLDDAISLGTGDADSVSWRDEVLEDTIDYRDAELVDEWAERVGSPYRGERTAEEVEQADALRALADLLRRYCDGEFRPPEAWR